MSTNKKYSANYINLYNDFLANAKATISQEKEDLQKLTFKTISSVVGLIQAIIESDNREGNAESVFIKDSQEISESKLRARIFSTLFNVEEKAELKSGEGRAVYKKVRAGLIIWSLNKDALHSLWVKKTTNKKDSSVDDILQAIAPVVESYGSLTKILELGKNPQKPKASDKGAITCKVDSDSESTTTADNESDSTAESQKSPYTRIAESLTNVKKTLDKMESIDALESDIIAKTLKELQAQLATIRKVKKARKVA